MKIKVGFLSAVIFLLTATSNIGATVIQYGDGEYVSPYGYSQVGYYANPRYLPWHESFSMGHNDIYEWTLNDLPDILDLENQDEYLNVVFHGIYNNYEPDNDKISLYIKNNEQSTDPGMVRKEDPNTSDVWDGWMAFDGTWSYPTPADPDEWGFQDGSLRFDVVFSLLIDETVEAWLTDGGTYTLGIDSDCHYNGRKITAEAPAPVPEPASIILLGTGLVSLVGGARSRKKRLDR